ncbi:hypothetical protein [Roseospira navarrensis]|uniref:Helix-turn-helix domain-containing protein n=1 Tax=Roseospira navarrensis TaxID=140058 RepID=A0A7X1ZG19_9PROT|nr:hypothetical protein [Roseospira navarrensis]MQX37889.1 hypothetical protein [Roseospira navarrensis]
MNSGEVMHETVTKGEFAQMIGRAPSAISNWIAAGTLSGAALAGEGRSARVVVPEALRQLGMKLDVRQQMAQARPIETRTGTSPAVTRGAVADAQERLAAAKAEREELALMRERAEARARNGDWLPTAQARSEFAGVLHQVIRTTEVWLQVEAPQAVLASLIPDDVDALAERLGTSAATVRGVLAALGVDQRALGVTLRDGYRDHRRQVAARAGVEAEAEPPFVPEDGAAPDPEESADA